MAVARLGRLLALSAIVAPLLLVRNLLGPTGGPRVLRWYLEACGGGYVKVGQLLATRYDLLRFEYTEELGKLFDSLRPVPTPKIIQEIERGLGRPLPRLLRRGVVLGIVAVIGLAVIKPDLASTSALGRFALRIEDNPWPALGAGVLAVILLNSFIRRMETT
jgi:hypothetical protein